MDDVSVSADLTPTNFCNRSEECYSLGDKASAFAVADETVKAHGALVLLAANLAPKGKLFNEHAPRRRLLS